MVGQYHISDHYDRNPSRYAQSQYGPTIHGGVLLGVELDTPIISAPTISTPTIDGLVTIDGDLLIDADNWTDQDDWTPAMVQGVALTSTVGWAEFQIIQGRCFFNAMVTITSAGTAGQNITMSTPVPAKTGFPNDVPMGGGRGVDLSASANNRVGNLYLTTVSTMRIIDAAGGWGNNPNFAAENGDVFQAQGHFPVA